MAILQGRGMAVVVVLAMVLMSVHYSSAAEFRVGDGTAWSLSSLNYNSWATSKPIRLNDQLRFLYSSEMHNVLMVSKVDYDRCASRRPFVTYADGNTVVRLTKRGTYYFICGVPGHCEGGMKMQVTVR